MISTSFGFDTLQSGGKAHGSRLRFASFSSAQIRLTKRQNGGYFSSCRNKISCL